MTPRVLSRTEARTFYDRVGAMQDSQRFYEDPALAALIAHAAFDTASAVVEFGCGTGRLARTLLAERLPPAATYRGFDLSPRMVALARRRLAPWAGRADVVLTDGEGELPVPDGAADRFVSTYVLDLLADPDIDVVLAGAARVTRPGGRLCLVSLTDGPSGLARLVSRTWRAIHQWNPVLVGGCRPIHPADRLDARAWAIGWHEVVVAYGVSSDVLVAERLH